MPEPITEVDELAAARKRVEADHLCDCETCRRSNAICPATAGSLIDELAQLRIATSKLSAYCTERPKLIAALRRANDALSEAKAQIEWCRPSNPHSCPAAIDILNERITETNAALAGEA